MSLTWLEASQQDEKLGPVILILDCKESRAMYTRAPIPEDVDIYVISPSYACAMLEDPEKKLPENTYAQSFGGILSSARGNVYIFKESDTENIDVDKTIVTKLKKMMKTDTAKRQEMEHFFTNEGFTVIKM